MVGKWKHENDFDEVSEEDLVYLQSLFYPLTDIKLKRS